jgi:hypothetical protein
MSKNDKSAGANAAPAEIGTPIEGATEATEATTEIFYRLKEGVSNVFINGTVYHDREVKFSQSVSSLEAFNKGFLEICTKD